MMRPPPRPTLFPYTTLFRSLRQNILEEVAAAGAGAVAAAQRSRCHRAPAHARSEEHTSELQSRFELVCRLLLEKKNNFTSKVFPSNVFTIMELELSF